jgi:hypothetical protein
MLVAWDMLLGEISSMFFLFFNFYDNKEMLDIYSGSILWIIVMLWCLILFRGEGVARVLGGSFHPVSTSLLDERIKLWFMKTIYAQLQL